MEYEERIPNDTRTRIYLQPIAAPSILGLYGFAGATFMVAANMAHWYGSAYSGLYLFPFAAIFGGLAQFLAGMWAFKARDGLATAIHGMWGSFWMAYGILMIIFAVGKIPPSMAAQEEGFWFIVLAAITWVGAVCARAENNGLLTVLAFLAACSTAAAFGDLAGSEWVMILAGWLLIISAIAAWYTASAMMLNDKFGREVWRIGKAQHAKLRPPLSIGTGETGVIKGQA
ncbi:MAG: acetate uptake transporter [Bryobacteraceae bacterium]